MSTTPQKPMNIHSLRERTTNVSNVEIPLPSTRPKMRTKWQKIRQTRRCGQCGHKLENVIAFREVPISFCDECQCEVEL